MVVSPLVGRRPLRRADQVLEVGDDVYDVLEGVRFAEERSIRPADRDPPGVGFGRARLELAPARADLGALEVLEQEAPPGLSLLADRALRVVIAEDVRPGLLPLLRAHAVVDAELPTPEHQRLLNVPGPRPRRVERGHERVPGAPGARRQLFEILEAAGVFVLCPAEALRRALS